MHYKCNLLFIISYYCYIPTHIHIYIGILYLYYSTNINIDKLTIVYLLL